MDIGTWEYYLNKENTDWYLKGGESSPAAGTQTVTPAGGNTPDEHVSVGNVSADSQPVPANAEPDSSGSDKTEHLVRQKTKSADAILDIATAPAYVFNSELQSLRFRHNNTMQNARSSGGLWGQYIGSDNRISGGSGAGYSLKQNGIVTGGDNTFTLNNASLAVGWFVSHTRNSVIHNRGSNSTVRSTGGGIYATWLNDNGYYVDSLIKLNHFSNELHSSMSDGTAVKGAYRQYGFGGSLEVGRTFGLNDNAWIQPYVRGTAFLSGAKDIKLDNGMVAKSGAIKSFLGEGGVSMGINLDISGKTVMPYFMAAVSHEFSDKNRVRINNRYDFTNDISDTTMKLGTGLSAKLTENTSVWAETSYQKGEKMESPLSGVVGVRVNF